MREEREIGQLFDEERGLRYDATRLYSVDELPGSEQMDHPMDKVRLLHGFVSEK